MKVIAVPDNNTLEVAVSEDNQKDNKTNMKVQMEKPMTKPPAVGVTPARIGRVAANFHRTAPFSASKAVSHPFAFAGGSICWLAAPNHPAPFGGTGAFAGTSCTVVHQSTAPT